MRHSRVLFLAVCALALSMSLPLLSGPIGPQTITKCAGVLNDFGTPSGEFGNCWSTIGDVTAGAAGVGPTISQGTGLDTSAANLQTFIGNGSSFLFSSFTAETIGTGSAIQNSLTLTGSGSLNVAFTTQTPTGSIGFLVVENLGNSSFSFITLFDIPLAVMNLSPIQLGAGNYELTIGIAGASSLIAVNAGIGAAATGPAITGVTIQDTSVPEPAAVSLLTSGLATMVLLRRRVLRSSR
ncbi:MAG TPA: PEP-CTERM sorting domain-containing protein [Bryobacteraceae bacterium]|nr:PEP-CTERM sorting domain-containing protein [Bryobacteraceae bacterium]